MSFKAYPNAAAAQDAAEALGRLYAQSIGSDYPMPPDYYGPGRQPEPREAYYQKWYAPAKPAHAAIPADPVIGIPAQPARPDRLDVDAFAAGQSGQTVQIHGGRQVTLNFQGLQEE